MQTGNTDFINKNDLDKSKNLGKRTQSDKVLRDKAFEIASNPKYDGYQRGLAIYNHIWLYIASPLWYPSYFGLLAISNALSLKTLSDWVLFPKFFDLSRSFLLIKSVFPVCINFSILSLFFVNRPQAL